MATTTIQTTLATTTTPPKQSKQVCFSFAAYAKNLIYHLQSLNVPILPGLNDDEFAYIESAFNFTFPPDLRSILREGLPVGPAFPNWRSSSQQQLQILLNLPLLSLSRNVAVNNFWTDSWGQKPQEKNQTLSLVKRLLEKAPVLVPIYRNCYIPSVPNIAGNPVFYIDCEKIKVLSFDLAGFFKEVEFSKAGNFKSVCNIDMPVWAAKEARRIGFWTEVAERGKRVVARGETRGWWNDGGGLRLDCCLEAAFWKLRDGGWREEEVREMMLMDGCDEDDQKAEEKIGAQLIWSNFKDRIAWQMRVLSLVLLRAGWSREEVEYSLSLEDFDHYDSSKIDGNFLQGINSTSTEFQHPKKKKIIKKGNKKNVGVD
ncbi:uncharacterized protein LOC123215582 [Mangifera indica]|uniref:uncharacterized protein LOC123215582 n=1 Tax=Mangifera indica TaxID=29780 RepID=UPI001CFA160D|nr:uncharacterized protein LOC123215582 [Mangifera indica]